MTEPTDTRRPPASEHPGTPQTCTDDLDEDHVPPLALLSAHQATGALPRGGDGILAGVLILDRLVPGVGARDDQRDGGGLSGTRNKGDDQVVAVGRSHAGLLSGLGCGWFSPCGIIPSPLSQFLVVEPGAITPTLLAPYWGAKEGGSEDGRIYWE